MDSESQREHASDVALRLDRRRRSFNTDGPEIDYFGLPARDELPEVVDLRPSVLNSAHHSAIKP